MNGVSDSPSRVAVVVAGAGARGGYEAGVLSVLVPRLYHAGVQNVMFVGTSAGAINATIFAALAHLPPAEQAQQALQIWRSITVSDVFRSPTVGFPGIAARVSGQLLHIPGLQFTHLLDTEPLRRTAERVIDWNQLRDNIASRRQRHDDCVTTTQESYRRQGATPYCPAAPSLRHSAALATFDDTLANRAATMGLTVAATAG